MIIASEEEITQKARELIGYLAKIPMFNEQTQGETILVLATVIYIMGIQQGLERGKVPAE